MESSAPSDQDPVPQMASGSLHMFRSSSGGAGDGGGGETSKAVAQYCLDASLHAVFEKSDEAGESFHYSRSVHSAPSSSSVSGTLLTAFLCKIQRGGLIQPFGCLLAVDVTSFRVLAFSENAPEMLDVLPQRSVPSVDNTTEPLTLGTDVRSLFTNSSSILLEGAFAAPQVTLLNPLSLHARTSSKPFYAILHRIDAGIVIDLEPTKKEDPAISIIGAVQSQQLALHAISLLQALPSGDVQLLLDTIVGLVRELTGYDRVMVYRFHEDEHGEVVAESKRQDLEPYIGLHYPATDLPQAARFLFKQNRVRMIANCHAAPVRVIQHKSLAQPLCLVGSTLRAPHGCHLAYMVNMGSIASLVMAVVINSSDEERKNSMKLWGLVVCHHTSPRCISFPLRSACEFLMQAFALQLNMELQLALQLSEKRILKTQTLLCDRLLRDSLIGIVTQIPSIMDLVRCDGAALYYQGKYYTLGVAPTEPQVKDIIRWLSECHGDSTGLSTDSLTDAGYAGAAALGNAVCGMAMACITPKDYLFWFRSHAAKHIRWGGAKHNPEDKDDEQQMHPRSSFKAFLQEVKSRSIGWEQAEMDAVHSLQLILRDSFRNVAEGSSNSKVIIGDLELQGLHELTAVAKQMVRLIETATAPIFAVDSDGRINGWNAKISELTGLSVEEAMGKSLVHDLVYEEYEDVVEKLLYRALRGEEDKSVEIKLKTFGSQQFNNAIFVIVNACSSRDYTNNIVGVGFVGQDVTEQNVVMDKFIRIEGDYKAIVHSPNPLIPPIFSSDNNTCCSEWNPAMEKLTGWLREEVIGKLLVGEVFGGCCRLKGPDALTKFMIILHKAIGGKETEKFPFSFYCKNGKHVQALLTANARSNINDQVTGGASCFLQIASPELQQALESQRQQEKEGYVRMKELAFISQEIKNPLSGIQFTKTLLEMAKLNNYQKQLLETSASCERQLLKIINDADLQIIDYDSLVLEKDVFSVGRVINAVVSQVMILVREKGLELIRNIPEEIKEISVFGDQFRIQQVLAEFLLNIVQHAPLQSGCVDIQASSNLKQNSVGTETILLLFRFACPGEGLPPQLVQDMFHDSHWMTQEGYGLSKCRKILESMGGEVQYVRESEMSFFLTKIELPTSQEVETED